MSEAFVIDRITSYQAKMRSVASVAPLVAGDHVFEIPAKLIKTPADMKIWEKSEAYFEFLGFILAINEAIKGKSNSVGSEKLSETVVKLVEILNKLDSRIDETPPVQQPQRFGNVAFRTWYQKMRDDSLVLLQESFRPELYKAIPEVVTYLVESFGNATRIDYGTGHELSFVMFMCCLFKIDLLKTSDKVAAGCCIFPRYLDLVRKLQKTYRMEPAGSHGVWSLDDFQFVPFIWGSSQLFAHPRIEPSMFLNQQVLNEFGEDYMFLTCIQYINSVKSGPFAEHSNQLWSISGVSSWSKINGGLIKMYKAEVLSKFPVVQHIVFGSLFTLKVMEQCRGLMTAKTSMVPPPVPYYHASERASKESSTLSVQSGEEKSGGSSKQSSDKLSSAASSIASKQESTQASVTSKQESTRASVTSKPESTQASISSKQGSIRGSTQGSLREPSKTSAEFTEKISEEKVSSDTSIGPSAREINAYSKESSEGSIEAETPKHRGSIQSNSQRGNTDKEEMVRFSKVEAEDGDKVSLGGAEREHGKRTINTKTAFNLGERKK